jgi:RHS repeat-associated protein
MMEAAKEEMLSSFVPWCAETGIGARTSEGKKPHQGVATKKSAHFLGHEVCNSTTALGLRGQAALDRIGSRCTGKERDSETGLDYFEARYYASNMGRFMSVDPNMESVHRSNPQTWNRYAYVLNNPLSNIDPTGEIWVSSNDANNPYKWQDSCNKGQTCYNQIAAQVGESVMVYGPKDASDHQTFGTNDNGYIDASKIAGTDGAFFEFQSGVTNTFASPQTAVDLYNAAGEYHDAHPNDSKLSLNDIGSSTGGAIPPHSTHDLGRSVDMRYMDPNGKTTNNVLNADDNRAKDMVGTFKANGFNQNYSDNNQSYGTGWAPGHANHIHFGKDAHTAKCEISSCK